MRFLSNILLFHHVFITASTDYVIATTNIINGKTFVDSAIEAMDKIPVNNG